MNPVNTSTAHYGVRGFKPAASSIFYTTKYREAARLGIEALDRIRNARAIGHAVPAALLPGETEE